MKQIQPIRNKKDCDAATREIERLMVKETSKKLTKAEAARLEVLATLVDAYESALVQDVPPDPVEALKFRLERLGLPLADLRRTLGSRPRASEILSRKPRMRLPMIRKVHEECGVPPGRNPSHSRVKSMLATAGSPGARQMFPAGRALWAAGRSPIWSLVPATGSL